MSQAGGAQMSEAGGAQAHLPICAMSTARPTCRMKVDLPPLHLGGSWTRQPRRQSG